MPTAYLSPSLLRELTDVSVSNPGAGEAGRSLAWNGTAFVLRTSAESRTDLGLGTLATQNANAVSITGGAISGITPLPLASGGTNSNNGSITGTGALTLAAATNNNLTLSFSGTGSFLLNQGATTRFGIKSNGIIHFFGEPISDVNLPFQIRASNGIGYFSINDGSNYAALIGYDTTVATLDGIVIRNTKAGSGSGADINLVVNNTSRAIKITGNTEVIFYSTTASTSTTTGAVRIGGGLGVASNVNIGGNLRFDGGTVPATAASAGTTGDIRYDGSHLYICTATNTWVRAALSTW